MDYSNLRHGATDKTVLEGWAPERKGKVGSSWGKRYLRGRQMGRLSPWPGTSAAALPAHRPRGRGTDPGAVQPSPPRARVHGTLTPSKFPELPAAQQGHLWAQARGRVGHPPACGRYLGQSSSLSPLQRGRLPSLDKHSSTPR